MIGLSLLTTIDGTGGPPAATIEFPVQTRRVYRATKPVAGAAAAVLTQEGRSLQPITPFHPLRKSRHRRSRTASSALMARSCLMTGRSRQRGDICRGVARTSRAPRHSAQIDVLPQRRSEPWGKGCRRSTERHRCTTTSQRLILWSKKSEAEAAERTSSREVLSRSSNHDASRTRVITPLGQPSSSSAWARTICSSTFTT
jgi:hypothetical protein